MGPVVRLIGFYCASGISDAIRRAPTQRFDQYSLEMRSIGRRPSSWGVDELVAADRDADVRCPAAHRVEEHQIARLEIIGLDLFTFIPLMLHVARQRRAVLREDPLHEAAAIKSVGRLTSTVAIGSAPQCERGCDDSWSSRKGAGRGDCRRSDRRGLGRNGVGSRPRNRRTRERPWYVRDLATFGPTARRGAPDPGE
jgi:hypothetical protein